MKSLLRAIGILLKFCLALIFTGGPFFLLVIDNKAKEQIRRMCSYDATAGCKVRIMPDVHFGKGCTIGTTMTIVDKA